MSGARIKVGRRASFAPSRPRPSGRPTSSVQVAERMVCWWCGRTLLEPVLVLTGWETCADCSETLGVPGRYFG